MYSSIKTKAEFWDYVHFQLQYLLEGQRYWVRTIFDASTENLKRMQQVSNLSNAASLIFNSLLAFDQHFGRSERAVNWAGMFSRSTEGPTIYTV